MIKGPDLVLASSSPRRRQILDHLGLRHEVIPPQIEEQRRPGEPAADFARRAAREKAAAVVERWPEDRSPRWVLGADTVVVVDGEPLGKPDNDAEARQMITTLSGRQHQVMTGWALLRTDGRASRSGVEVTTVWFKALRASEVEAYVATGEGTDKAGAYGIQGLGCFLVERIEGNYENVVGLPASPLVEALLELGALEVFPLPAPAAPEGGAR